MSEPKLTSAVSEAIEPPKTFLQKLLDGATTKMRASARLWR
jgi:hypothetical protein